MVMPGRAYDQRGIAGSAGLECPARSPTRPMAEPSPPAVFPTELPLLPLRRTVAFPLTLQHGLPADAVAITDDALRLIIGEHTREAGVRNLERQIGTVARKVAARVATGAISGLSPSRPATSRVTSDLPDSRKRWPSERRAPAWQRV